MYLLFGLFFAIFLLFFILFYFRRHKIICKIRSMDRYRKITLLNELLEPYGFTYLATQDVISSTVNAWQRSFGYHSLFDLSAARFNMVFDCEPIYFDYDNQTWLIEFWKGQYGINTGAEVGIYVSDTIVPPNDCQKTHFNSVSNEQMLPISIVLFRNADSEALCEICCKNCECPQGCCQPVPLFWINRRHWWLTGFRMGQYCEPEELAMRAALTFPNLQMQQKFIQALESSGYKECDLRIHGLTVSLLFSEPHAVQPRSRHSLITWMARRKNQLFCLLYQRVTRPFSCTYDKLLYLYYFLPPVFRHMLKFKKNRAQVQ